jgi:hypothetical protein
MKLISIVTWSFSDASITPGESVGTQERLI